MQVFGVGEGRPPQGLHRLFHRIERIGGAGQQAVFHHLVKGFRQRVGAVVDRYEPAPGVKIAHRHPVHGEGAGFVDAEHRGGPDRFNGADPPRENPVPGNPPGPQRQKDGHHHREFFRKHRHGQGETGQKSVQPVASRHPIGDHDHRAQQKPERGDTPHQAAGLPLQGRILGHERLQRPADVADLGGDARRHHPGDAAPHDHQGTGEDARLIVSPRRPHFGHPVRGRLFADRHRFAGQEGLVDRQVERLDHQGVGGHAVALLQKEKIAPHHLPPGNADFFTAPDHERAGARQVPERFQGPFGLPLLVEGDAHDDEDKPQQHQRLPDLARQKIDQAAGQKKQEHRLPDNLPGDAPDPALPGGGKLVVAVFRKAPLDLFIAQAGREHIRPSIHMKKISIKNSPVHRSR